MKLVKKIFSLVLVLGVVVSLSSCGVNKTQKGNSKKIVIVKQLDHSSIDMIAENIESSIKDRGEKEGLSISVEVYSGQNDNSTLKQIGDNAISKGADIIVPIGTLAAQVMVTCAEKTNTPVIYAAVSDPESAGLTGISNVSGTSDALDTSNIFNMINKYNENVKTIGLLYSKSEINSEKSIAEMKKLCENKGIKIIDATGNTNEEVISAAKSLVSSNVDAVFTPTDNIVMNAAVGVSEEFSKNKIPYFTGADSFVTSGAFATCGVNYEKLGKETGSISVDVLVKGMESLEEVYYINGGTITYNEDIAKILEVDGNIFKELGDELVPVKTEE